MGIQFSRTRQTKTETFENRDIYIYIESAAQARPLYDCTTKTFVRHGRDSTHAREIRTADNCYHLRVSGFLCHGLVYTHPDIRGPRQQQVDIVCRPRAVVIVGDEWRPGHSCAECEKSHFGCSAGIVIGSSRGLPPHGWVVGGGFFPACWAESRKIPTGLSRIRCGLERVRVKLSGLECNDGIFSTDRIFRKSKFFS